MDIIIIFQLNGLNGAKIWVRISIQAENYSDCGVTKFTDNLTKYFNIDFVLKVLLVILLINCSIHDLCVA